MLPIRKFLLKRIASLGPSLSKKLFNKIPAVKRAINADTNSAEALEGLGKLFKHMEGMGVQRGTTQLEQLAAKVLGPSIHTIPGKGHRLLLDPKSMPSPGVLAKEIGHAMNADSLNKIFKNKTLADAMSYTRLGIMHGPSLLASMPAAMASGLDASDSTVNALALGGAASMLPGAALETAAAIRGAKLMKQLGIKGRKSAFISLPMYALGMTAPLLPVIDRKIDAMV